MEGDAEFSSNRHSALPGLTEYEVPVRHPDFNFEDGNLALVTGCQYFVVHQGMLSHHSKAFSGMIKNRQAEGGLTLAGLTAIVTEDDPDELVCFLRVLYGFCVNLETKSFEDISALLRISTKYGVEELRKEAIRILCLSWPTSLANWETREKSVTSADGLYAPRPSLPHPIFIIELARETDVPELLPSAFYDLSRYLPSHLAAGHTTSEGEKHMLAQEDLLKILRGKEHGARFFSTFIVNELEGRTPSEFCLYRNDATPTRKRACQIAYEAITFELIRDVNGMVCNRNSDPLFAIAETFLMQTREDIPGAENEVVHRTCEFCRMEYGAVVDAVREELWRKIPEWFDLEVPGWG
ncbi:hypothetical protein CERSUDRAFT_154136 [Gelatoporia subvermispora B]|uniref:BTB domain-containing protein n=1 Tax=Ceriporiopsis subvermispora (strain B) TaxID=914234 RepID=M2QKF5_CERS8|nr:hypothetical protein CERSUDRAFT_154136 [Gelatoporia subvermispora B]